MQRHLSKVELKNQWWVEKALEMQRLADAGDTRGFLNATKAVWELLSGFKLSPLQRRANPTEG